MFTNLLSKKKGLQCVTKGQFLLTNVGAAFVNSLCIQTSNLLCDFLWFLSV